MKLQDHYPTEEDMAADDVDARVEACYPDRDDEDDSCYFLTAPQQARQELAFN